MLSLPPFVLAAALLLWGATAGLLPAAIVLALLVEAGRFSTLRFELRGRDFERIADSCSVLLAGALAYALFGSSNFTESLVAVLRWLPLLFAPLIVAQRLSTAGTVPLSALFWSLRRDRAHGSSVTGAAPASDADTPVAGSIDFAYLGACLLAAAGANVRAVWFYLALGALLLIGLWPLRRRGDGRLVWPAAAGAALALGFGIQASLSSMQSALEDAALQWLESRWQAHADPYRARTAIGDIGTLKFSDRILLRIDAPAHDAMPLLRHAAYTRYAAGAWSAPALPFRPLASDAHGWVLARGEGGKRLGMSGWAAEGRALLALPASTVRVNGLIASSVQANGIGAVRVEGAPQPLVYEAWYAAGADAGSDAGPGAEDLIVPAALAAPLREITDSLGLSATAPAEALDGVQGFFASGFEYSLDLDAPDGGGRSLARFLTQDRRGHCEYFATATVLLLRSAGIPARYATGYAVQEWSEIEQRYLVRARHAHAWALAWVGDRWQELDTTPAVWAQQDARRASPWQWLYDIGSALNYRFVMWRTQEHDGSLAWAWLIAPLAGWLLWRVWRRRARTTPKRRARAANIDASVVPLLDVLARLGYQRPSGAPLRAWLLALPVANHGLHAQLDDALCDYYRLRFDPAAERPVTAAALEAKVAALIARLDTITDARSSKS